MKIHLDECKPEGKGWQEMEFHKAIQGGVLGEDVMCSDVAYMWDELFTNELVYVESEEPS